VASGRNIHVACKEKCYTCIATDSIALADFLDINPERYKCCERPFYQERIVDGLGKCFIIFGCEELVNGVIRLGGNELHADATFKVVPSKPKSRQIFIMHIIIQNHVSLFKIIYDRISTLTIRS